MHLKPKDEELINVAIYQFLCLTTHGSDLENHFPSKQDWDAMAEQILMDSKNKGINSGFYTFDGLSFIPTVWENLL